MSATSAAPAAPDSPTALSPRPRSPAREAWHRFKRDRLAVACLVLFCLYALTAVLAQGVEATHVLTASDADRAAQLYDLSLHSQGIDVEENATPPSAVHWQAWLGTTSSGKSVLLRVFHGTKVAFVVGLCGAGLSVLIGMTLGLLAGFFGGWVDALVQYLYQTVASIPYLLLLLALAFVVRQGPVAEAWYDTPMSDYLSLGLFNIIVVIGLTSWVTLCRLVRAEVMKVRELDFVQAARSLGLGELRILRRHVLPNVFHLVIINFSLRFVTAIKSEVILTFLGVGVDKEPSWGQMIADAKNELMRGIWWPLLFSGLALFGLTLAINYVGDALRDALDPRLDQ